MFEAKGLRANVSKLTKPALRKQILAARRAVGAEVRAAEVRSLQTHLASLTAGAETICAYIPVGAEPGSTQLLEALTGVRVLVPVARDGEPMRWAEYRAGELVDAPFGLREPAPPWLPPETVARASVVLVPALAVDRRGVRLGRGAGFYDRALLLADPAARLVAVVRDSELVDELPAESHDVPMTHALTPRGGVIALG